ncbi:MAG: TetR family transcriptional regulator [Kordiimonadales bacterium]|nr:MAG: TetR family transcriptional regulator [Kordiimonadales bacterium]
MAETSTKKQQTHQRMLAAAGRSFRAHGFAGIGVDGIAKSAGVTSGAFYAHFGSKGRAFEAAITAGLDEVIAAIPVFRDEHGQGWIVAFADYYLGQSHRVDLGGGCAMTSLSPEVVRASPDVQAIYEEKMTLITRLVADGLAGGTDDARLARAWAMLSTLIGGLTTSRAVASGELADQIAAAVHGAALAAAGDAA